MRGTLTGALGDLAAVKQAVAKKARITAVRTDGTVEIEVDGEKGRLQATTSDAPLKVSERATVLSTGKRGVYVLVGWR